MARQVKMADLDGSNGQVHQVGYERDFLLDEGLGVAHTGKQTIVARRRKGALTNFGFGDEQAGAFEVIAILRTIGQQRFEAGFNVRSDVDDEGRANVSVERCVKDLVGAVRFAGDIEALQPGGETGFVAQRSRCVVVRVTSLPVWEDHDPRTQATQHSGHFQAILDGVLDAAVGQVERFSVRDTKDAGGCLGFRLPLGSGAAGAGFALRQIENAGLPAERLLDEQSSSAGLLYVVAVRGYGEDVYSAPPNDKAS